MEGLFVWATVGWLSFLLYAYSWWKWVGSKNPKKFNVNSVGAREALGMVAILFAWIVLVGFLSGALLSGVKNPSEANAVSDPNHLRAILVPLFVGVIAMMAIYILNESFLYFLGGVFPKGKWLIAGLLILMNLLLFFPASISQMSGLSKDTLLVNNLFLIVFFSIVVVPMGFMFRRSGVLTVFSLIMLLDIYLVWMSGGEASSGKQNWYITMVQSDLMKKWPVPTCIVSNSRVLGGGDMAFIAFGMIFASRAFNYKIAALFALISTLPLLFLPHIKASLNLSIAAWPYTIFIAPWAIFLCLASYFYDKKSSPAKINS